MSYETIKVEREGPLLVITLNRPERLNAMPPQMADEIGEAFYDLSDARAVLITGEGKGFCSGADLSARVARAVPKGAVIRRCKTIITRPSARFCGLRFL